MDGYGFGDRAYAGVPNRLNTAAAPEYTGPDLNEAQDVAYAEFETKIRALMERVDTAFREGIREIVQTAITEITDAADKEYRRVDAAADACANMLSECEEYAIQARNSASGAREANQTSGLNIVDIGRKLEEAAASMRVMESRMQNSLELASKVLQEAQDKALKLSDMAEVMVLRVENALKKPGVFAVSDLAKIRQLGNGFYTVNEEMETTAAGNRMAVYSNENAATMSASLEGAELFVTMGGADTSFYTDAERENIERLFRIKTEYDTDAGNILDWQACKHLHF